MLEIPLSLSMKGFCLSLCGSVRVTIISQRAFGWVAVLVIIIIVFHYHSVFDGLDDDDDEEHHNWQIAGIVKMGTNHWMVLLTQHSLAPPFLLI